MICTTAGVEPEAATTILKNAAASLMSAIALAFMPTLETSPAKSEFRSRLKPVIVFEISVPVSVLV